MTDHLVLIDPPTFAPGVRVREDKVRDRWVLLFPEGALDLNDTAVAVLELVDGQRSIDEISAILSEKFGGADVREDVAELLQGIADEGLLAHARR